MNRITEQMVCTLYIELEGDNEIQKHTFNVQRPFIDDFYRRHGDDLIKRFEKKVLNNFLKVSNFELRPDISYKSIKLSFENVEYGKSEIILYSENDNEENYDLSTLKIDVTKKDNNYYLFGLLIIFKDVLSRDIFSKISRNDNKDYNNNNLVKIKFSKNNNIFSVDVESRFSNDLSYLKVEKVEYDNNNHWFRINNTIVDFRHYSSLSLEIHGHTMLLKMNSKLSGNIFEIFVIQSNLFNNYFCVDIKKWSSQIIKFEKELTEYIIECNNQEPLDIISQ